MPPPWPPPPADSILVRALIVMQWWFDTHYLPLPPTHPDREHYQAALDFDTAMIDVLWGPNIDTDDEEDA